MKKRLFLLAFAALTATLSAMAEEYIKVSNREMSFTESWTKPSSYFNDTSGSGSISWDAAKRKLTLNKFDIWRGWEVGAGTNVKTCIEVYSTKSVTIEVVGKNYVKNGKGQTLALHGNTTFTGNGTLKLSNYDNKKPGIDLLEENIDITVNGPKLMFECKNGGIRGKNNTGTLHLKAGEVQSSSDGKLVTGLADVTFDYGMGVKSPHGVRFSQRQHCMIDVDLNPITSQKVELDTIQYYGFRICGKEITENNYNLINPLFGTDITGSVWFSPQTNRLILDNSSINNWSEYPGIENYDNDGLIIQLIGENKIISSGGWLEALYLKKNTTIMSFEPDGKLSNTADFAGIYVASNKSLTLQNVDITMAHLIGGNANSDLNIGNGVVLIAKGSDEGAVRSLNIINKSDKPSIAVFSDKRLPRFIWNRADGAPSSGVYQDNIRFAPTPVILTTRSMVESLEIKWYPVSVCGTQVTTINNTNIQNQYIVGGLYDTYIEDTEEDGIETGPVYFNPRTNQLRLSSSIKYTGNSQDKAVIESWGDATFKIRIFSGTKIECGKAPAINCKGDLEIMSLLSYSNSALFVTGSNAKIYTGGHLRFKDVTANVTELEAKYLEVDNSHLSVTRNLDVKCCKLTNEKLASTPEAPAYRWGDGDWPYIVTPKGKAYFLPSSEVTVYPGIKFCGQEINSANASCVMAQSVASGRMAVEKKTGGYDIILEDLQVLKSQKAPVFEFTNNLNDVYVKLYGKNYFKFNGTYSTGNQYLIKSNAKNLTLAGYGTEARFSPLLVPEGLTADAGAISLAGGCGLCVSNSFSNSFYVSASRIFGTDENNLSSLCVNDPYLTLTGGYEGGTLGNIKCALPTGLAELYSTSSLPLTIGDDGIYMNGKLYTGEVKFVAKGESYIPVNEVRLFPPDWIFERKGQTAQLSAEIYPEDATNKNVVWASTDESVAKVDKNGKVTAVGKGQALIFGYSEDMAFDIENPSTYINACDVHVLIPEPTDITLSETEVLIDRESIGGVYLTASLTPSNADTEYTWESSDTTVVTVKENSGKTALVRRVADEGEATVTVKTSNGLKATCKVTIHYPITPMFVEFEQRTYTLTEVGEQLKLEPIVTPDNCEKLSFTWYTSSDAISLSDDGTVTARRNGSAVVECWACYDGQKWAPGEVRINVEIPPTPVIATDLKLTAHHSIFHALGETFILTPVFTPENVTNQELTWDTTDASVATVDEDGFVTVVGWGDCYITATTTDGSNIKARYSITAIDPSTIPDPIYATGIRLDENEITLMRGEQAYIGITIEPADYNQSVMVEPMEGDISIAQVDAQWDWNTNRTSIYIRTEEWSEMSGDLKVRVRPNMVDWDKLGAMGIWQEPADTLTIHVLAPIIFAEASPEDINITYHVTDINDKTCEVYTQPRPGMTMIDPLDEELIPAVSQTATGKLTVPARANGYWVTNVMPCAFNRCSSLTEIEFSEGIETIGDYACYSRLFGLERVTLPSTIKELGQYCFSANSSDYATSEDPSGRNHIREVNIKSFTPPTGLNGSDINWTGAFHQVASDAVLYVPTGALANYNVEPWTQWFSRIEEKQFFEDQDGIKDLKDLKDFKDLRDSWFMLDGRKLGSKPAKPGLYIQNGKKVVIK